MAAYWYSYQTTCNYEGTSTVSSADWYSGSPTTSTTWYTSPTTITTWENSGTCNHYQITDNTVYVYVETPAQTPAQTPEQVEENRRQEQALAEERLAKYREIEAKRAKAEEKAIECLLDLLGPEQAETYKRTGNLLVKGVEFDWLLTKEGRVYRCEKDKVVQLCLHSEEKHRQPDTDNVITLALHAKFAEKEMARGNFQHSFEKKSFKIPEAANF